MTRFRQAVWPLLLAAAAFAQPAFAAPGDALSRLAAQRDCTGCHATTAAPTPAGGPARIGPSFADVAARYRGQPGAEARLVQVVVSGSNPYASHWKDQVAGLAMPPNATQVNEADARRLVRWILGMAPGATR